MFRELKDWTPEEFGVIFWIVILILVGFGAVCLIVGYRAPVEKAEQAYKLIRIGYGFLAVGFATYFIYSLVRRL